MTGSCGAAALPHCRTLRAPRYTVARDHRRTGWRRGPGRRAPPVQHAAERHALRAAFPDDAALHRPGLHEVRARLDRTSHAVFFRRRATGEQAGFARVPGRDRSPSCTDTA